MSAIETFTFTQEVKLADADGVAISEGSVLVNIKDGDRGVVVKVGRKGAYSNLLMFSIGDIAIQKGPGITRVTNCYGGWRHIPKKDQTYQERLLSWLQTPYEHDEYHNVSRGEGCAISGIMALLPDEIVDWDYGPFPDRIEDALRFLAEHLEEIQTKKEK